MRMRIIRGDVGFRRLGFKVYFKETTEKLYTHVQAL